MSQVRFQVLVKPAWSDATRIGPRTASAQAQCYIWRLVGANNRELGRSALNVASYELARDGIERLKQGVGRLVCLRSHAPATGRWSWRLDLDGSAVAVSSRWYERDQDCALAVAKFLSLAAKAELVDGVTAQKADARGGAGETAGADQGNGDRR